MPHNINSYLDSKPKQSSLVDIIKKTYFQGLKAIIKEAIKEGFVINIKIIKRTINNTITLNVELRTFVHYMADNFVVRGESTCKHPEFRFLCFLSTIKKICDNEESSLTKKDYELNKFIKSFKTKDSDINNFIAANKNLLLSKINNNKFKDIMRIVNPPRNFLANKYKGIIDRHNVKTIAKN